MGQQPDDVPIYELSERAEVTCAAHEDGLVIIEVNENDVRQAFVTHPAFAERLGEMLFKVAQQAKVNMERKAQDG